jgi:hypothetical protein
MSMDLKDKENNKNGWSSDTIIELNDTANEQLNILETLSLAHIHTKCQQELESWHAAAVEHLGQIFSQRLADLAQVYTKDVCPESEKFKQKMTEQLKNRIMPRISKVLDEPTPDTDKVDKMQVCRFIYHRIFHCFFYINYRFRVFVRVMRRAFSLRPKKFDRY